MKYLIVHELIWTSKPCLWHVWQSICQCLHIYLKMESLSASFIFEIDSSKNNQGHICDLWFHSFTSKVDHHVLVFIMSRWQWENSELPKAHMCPKDIISQSTALLLIIIVVARVVLLRTFIVFSFLALLYYDFWICFVLNLDQRCSWLFLRWIWWGFWYAYFRWDRQWTFLLTYSYFHGWRYYQRLLSCWWFRLVGCKIWFR